MIELLLEAPTGRLEAQTQRGTTGFGSGAQGSARSAPLPLGLESGAVGAGGPTGGQEGSAGGLAGVMRGETAGALDGAS